MTEDGIKFRIYRCGNLEIRTTQEPNTKEIIVAVFSMGAAECKQVRQVEAYEKITKVTQYVERAGSKDGQQDDLLLHSRSYVMLKTERGNCIVTEKLQNGTVTWQENPQNI